MPEWPNALPGWTVRFSKDKGLQIRICGRKNVQFVCLAGKEEQALTRMAFNRFAVC